MLLKALFRPSVERTEDEHHRDNGHLQRKKYR